MGGGGGREGGKREANPVGERSSKRDAHAKSCCQMLNILTKMAVWLEARHGLSGTYQLEVHLISLL